MLSKHKMLGKFLLLSPNIWGSSVHYHEKRPRREAGALEIGQIAGYFAARADCCWRM